MNATLDLTCCLIRTSAQRSLFLMLLLLIMACVSACSTFQPKPFDESKHLNRAALKSDGDITVTATILTREEAEELFGFDFTSAPR